MPVSYKPQGKIPPGILARALMGISELFGSDPHPDDQPYGLLARSILEAQPVRKPASIGPLSEEKEYSDRMAAMQRANPDTGLDPQGLAFQMFAGPLAKTANKAMLKKAQGMLDEGVDRAKIWADTGWFKDVDDKWKFEIDDSAASLQWRDPYQESVDLIERDPEAAKKISRYLVMEEHKKTPRIKANELKAYEEAGILHHSKAGTVEAAIKHPDLTGAYPEINKYGMERTFSLPDNLYGQFSERKYQPGLGDIAINKMYNKERQGSTALHELQHAVQGREGFAPGGNPQAIAIDPSQYLPEVKTAKEALYSAAESRGGKLAEDMDKWLRGEVVPSTTVDRIQKELKKMPEYAAYKAAMESADPYGIYKRLAGEAEARNVQTRMNFSPQERMAKPPWTTLDVPEDQLIVRNLLGMDVGPQASIVYHGSPHRFDAFDMSKIGTGEGAQAYGHGLYFADNPEVATSYREVLSRDLPHKVEGGGESATLPAWLARKIDASGIDDALIEWENRLKHEEVMASGDVQPWIHSANADRLRGEVDAMRKMKAAGGANVETPGNLYEVDLPDEAIGKMLDWDKPLSEQPEAVRKALEAEFRDLSYYQRANEEKFLGEPMGFNGAEFYQTIAKQMGDKNTATDYLNSIGVKGIKYLDQGSRGTGQGTYNYVVFDDKLPTILKRNEETLAERLRSGR